MEFERPIVNQVTNTILKGLPVMHVLIGPRQVGKTTIALQTIKKLPFAHVYATADSPIPLGPEWIETQWRLAELELQRDGQPVFLVLDEVQKVKGWSESIKLYWDKAIRERKDLRVLILGSSALMMQFGLSESLAGRFMLTRCPHWSYAECKTAFGWDLSTWLYYGGYPGAAAFIENEDEWRMYVADSLIETVISRDVLQMQNITKPTLLRHLFGLAAQYPAQIFSYNKMLGQLQDAGNTTTLSHYLDLLESAFLLSGLEAFSLGQKRKRGSSPKLILFNNALINALSSKSFNDTVTNSSCWGRLIENAVGAHICNGLAGMGYEITYWREGNNEVDFVISKGDRVWAIEVKSGRSFKYSGMKRFRSKYPQAGMLVIGTGGIELERFFLEPVEVWLV